MEIKMDYVLEKCSACKEGYICLNVQTDPATKKKIVTGAECNYCGAERIVPIEPLEEFGFSQEIQYTPQKVLFFQKKLADTYHYKDLDPIQASKYHNLYYVHLPSAFKCHLADQENVRMPLFTTAGTQIATGYRRIVIGDYGAFVEIPPTMFFAENMKCKEGEEYRLNDPRYAKNVKYFWLTAKDGSGIKIYQQIKRVTYADYLPNMFYVSPYEVRNGETIEIKE